jgi:hypothetical protein
MSWQVRDHIDRSLGGALAKEMGVCRASKQIWQTWQTAAVIMCAPPTKHRAREASVCALSAQVYSRSMQITFLSRRYVLGKDVRHTRVAILSRFESQLSIHGARMSAADEDDICACLYSSSHWVNGTGAVTSASCVRIRCFVLSPTSVYNHCLRNLTWPTNNNKQVQTIHLRFWSICPSHSTKSVVKTWPRTMSIYTLVSKPYQLVSTIFSTI